MRHIRRLLQREISAAARPTREMASMHALAPGVSAISLEELIEQHVV